MNIVPDKEVATALVDAGLLNRLRKRYNNAKTIADLWESILEACFHYAVPFRNRFYLPSKDFQGTMQNARLFDTTAVEGVKTFVSKIQDTMTPPQVQWGYLRIDDTDIPDTWSDDDIQNAQLILDEYMRKLFNYVHQSNFDVIVNECYFDLAVGTSCIVVNQGSDRVPLMFTSMPIDKLSIEEAVNGKIESWYREWNDLKISELHTRWKNIRLTPTMIKDLMADPDATVRMLYEGVCYFSNTDKPYCYAVWTQEALLSVEWLESNPGIVWRFQKTNNETWGRGPVMDALPTIISLNEMARIDLAAANLETFKPYMGFSDSVFNPHTFRLEPFTVIPVAPIGVGGQAPLIPLPGSANPQFAQLTIADLRMQVKTLLFAENPTDAMGVQPQTAYELALKQQTLAQKIGPLFSRVQYEFLEPLYKRIAYILHTMGLLPYPKLGGVPIRFKYLSPLQLAKGQQDIARFTQWVQLMQGIMGPEMTSVYVNPKNTPYLLADALQINPDFINRPEDVARVMQNVQDKVSSFGVDAAAMTPEQPANPSEIPISNA